MLAKVLVLVFTACLATSAEAQVFWSTPASKCVPDTATIKTNRHLVGNASVRHAAGNVDLIVLTCPVTPFTTAAQFWAVRITYRDSTGTNAQASVRAHLYRMAIGAATPVLMATADSNISDATGTNTVGTGQITHTFDFDANTYWIKVELDRTTTDQTVIVHSIRLDLT